MAGSSSGAGGGGGSGGGDGAPSVSTVKVAAAKAAATNSGGDVHDRLWGKHIIELLRVLAKDGSAFGRTVFTLKPQLTDLEYLASAFSFEALVNPSPAGESALAPKRSIIDDFEFEAEGATSTQCTSSDDSILCLKTADGLSGIIAFSVHELNPAALVTPLNAPSITDRGAVMIVTHKMESMSTWKRSKAEKTFRVHLEESDGTSSVDRLFLLTPSLLSYSLRWFFKVLEVCPHLALDFAVQLPPDLICKKALAREVVGKLVAAGEASDSTSRGVNVAGADADVVRLLEFWQQHHGVVTCMLNSDEESTWAFTSFGKRKLQTMNMLHKPRHVYKPREGVALRDLHVIELHDLLSSSGWECRVLVRKLRAKTAKNKDVKQAAELEDVQPVDYVDKGRKLWWLRPAMKCFSKSYFLALLLAE